MQAPFRQRYESQAPARVASFHASATRIALSGGVTFGRAMAGFTGMGTIEVVPAGVRIVARRHRYATNLAVAIAVGLVTAIAFGILVGAGKTDPEQVHIIHKSGIFWGIVAAIAAGSIASMLTRFYRPDTVVIDRAGIQHVQMIGPRLRIFSSRGDVELWIAEREGLQSLVQALSTLGIPLR